MSEWTKERMDALRAEMMTQPQGYQPRVLVLSLLDALEAAQASVPPGFRLVPEERTDEPTAKRLELLGLR